jgi:hypothetical protein
MHGLVLLFIHCNFIENYYVFGLSYLVCYMFSTRVFEYYSQMEKYHVFETMYCLTDLKIP